MSDVTNLIDSLRYRPVATTAAQMREAADELERLRAEVARLTADEQAMAEAHRRAIKERNALLARVEAAEKNAGRMREFLLAFINGGVNQDFRLWASEVLSDMEDGT